MLAQVEGLAMRVADIEAQVKTQVDAHHFQKSVEHVAHGDAQAAPAYWQLSPAHGAADEDPLVRVVAQLGSTLLRFASGWRSLRSDNGRYAG